jgi:acyl-CoA thioesterase
MEEEQIDEEIDEELLGESHQSVELRTHLRIDPTFGGTLLHLEDGYAKVELETTREMVVDEVGLVHGGFTFSAADFAAMAAVNHPNVVLVGCECRFLAPVKVGDKVVFEAKELYREARKRKIHVEGFYEEVKVFDGEFMAVVLERHVLKLKLVKDD